MIFLFFLSKITTKRKVQSNKLRKPFTLRVIKKKDIKVKWDHEVRFTFFRMETDISILAAIKNFLHGGLTFSFKA